MSKCGLPECDKTTWYDQPYCYVHYKNLQSWVDPNWREPVPENFEIRLPLQDGGGLLRRP